MGSALEKRVRAIEERLDGAWLVPKALVAGLQSMIARYAFAAANRGACSFCGEADGQLFRRRGVVICGGCAGRAKSVIESASEQETD